MGRQKLINLHTSGTTEPTSQLLEHGEIAVQYNAEAPIIYIKDTANEIRKFIDYDTYLQILDNTIIDCGSYYGPEYIDLGLPSGTLWAKCNLGASSPDEPGLYFQWGDISGYTYSQVGNSKVFNWANYKYCNGDYNKLTKYCPSSKTDYWDGSGEPDNKLILDQEDDAVVAMKGNEWVMPTSAQFAELVNNTTHYWDADRGGMVFAANGEELFLFGAGYAYNSSVGYCGSGGGYWSRSLCEGNPRNAWSLDFYGDGTCNVDYGSRYSGGSVRPVKSQNN